MWFDVRAVRERVEGYPVNFGICLLYQSIRSFEIVFDNFIFGIYDIAVRMCFRFLKVRFRFGKLVQARLTKRLHEEKTNTR